ncbi:uncharacterized protein [Rutidosis leptorrhynchoides]|uniref:uncharacterized protein n=1 Tax=Rutidosis leptorrhynchoides TaxID=125765 RepID=UPI003A99A136
MMLTSCKIFLGSGYPRGRGIQPYTLMYSSQSDYSVVVFNPSLATTGFKPETDDADSHKPILRSIKWELRLLKVPFLEYKTLSREKQRLWLAQHFIVKSIKTSTEVDAAKLEPEDEDEDEENNEIIMSIVCSDKIGIDAKLLERESITIQGCYELETDVIEIESNSEIIKKVESFCAERWKIRNDYAHDETLVRHKLNDFNSNFRQTNQIHALALMITAIDLKIKSLIDLMMEDIDDMFTKMTTADEAYKILSMNFFLFVNLGGEYQRL